MPTATMAEHLRHELARAGHAARPSAILTLSQFVDRLAPTPRAASPALLALHVADALDRIRPKELAAVSAYPGFRRSLTAAIGEIGASGTAVGRLLSGGVPGVYGPAITRIFERVEQTLSSANCALRYRRLALAGANWVDESEVFLDGFYSLNSSELELLRRIGERSALTVALPDTPDSSVRESLLARGFEEERFPVAHRNAEVLVFAAPSMAQEVNEIARRILEAVRGGVAFREIGVILRSREPYESALRAAFERFGIPSRSYFTEPAGRHPAARCVLGIARAVSAGGRLEDLLPAFRLAPFGLLHAEGDALGFELEEAAIGDRVEAQTSVLLTAVRALSVAASQEARTAADWGTLLCTFLLPPMPLMDGVSFAAALRWRTQQAAIETLTGLSRELGDFLGRTIPFDVFVRLLEDAANETPLRVADDRRNVVHVLDVFEARQWELPVVFVCGMLERQFPLYHSPDSLLSDGARRELGLPTSGGHQQEEKFLFDIAGSRATRQTIFSYPRFNEKGDDQIPSFFLRGRIPEFVTERVRPAPGQVAVPAMPGPLLVEFLAARHVRFSASSIERFLQCPFVFFGERTLKLRARPEAPNQRLNVLVQGSLMHELLARAVGVPPLFRDNSFRDGLFDEVFELHCHAARVPRNYRREAIRLELRRHFEAFLANREIALEWPIDAERKFELKVGPFAFTGRIDRLDVGPRKQALVVDYKYSGAQAVKSAAAQTADGVRLQAGLYMLAAERALGLKPVGMLYCGLRNEVTWSGWHALPAANALTMRDVQRVRPEDLRDMMQQTETLAIETVGEILGGAISPEPADTGKCKWCAYRDICRIETQKRPLTQVAGS